MSDIPRMSREGMDAELAKISSRLMKSEALIAVCATKEDISMHMLGDIPLLEDVIIKDFVYHEGDLLRELIKLHALIECLIDSASEKIDTQCN